MPNAAMRVDSAKLTRGWTARGKLEPNNEATFTSFSLETASCCFRARGGRGVRAAGRRMIERVVRQWVLSLPHQRSRASLCAPCSDRRAAARAGRRAGGPRRRGGHSPALRCHAEPEHPRACARARRGMSRTARRCAFRRAMHRPRTTWLLCWVRSSVVSIGSWPAGRGRRRR